MNILPKKRWHVRTKDNVARVRRDQAKAKEEELELIRRKNLAEKEARINELRSRIDTRNLSPQPSTSAKSNSQNAEHVNLFVDYEMGLAQSNAANKEYIKEQLEITQNYEKKIGLLTFLGQDTNEELKLKSWYELPRDQIRKVNEEKDEIAKQKDDPLNLIKMHCGKKEEKKSEVKEVVMDSHKILENKFKKEKKQKKKKKKKEKDKEHGKKEKSSKDILKKLREERLRREAMEKSRQKEIILKAKGLTPLPSKQMENISQIQSFKQKYNSQFNPELAKQNMPRTLN